MRYFPLSVSAALVLSACGSEHTSPEPSTSPDFARTPVQYVAIDLGTLGGTTSEASAINSSGQVVGRSAPAPSTPEHAFLWQDGVMRDLGKEIGGASSQALDINDIGQVAGTFIRGSDGAARGFVWHNGSVRRIGTLGGSGSRAFGINRKGQVTGESETATGEVHPYLWKNGVMRDLAQPVGTQNFRNAYGINDRTHIVGGTRSSPVLWIRGTARILDSPTGGVAYAINKAGDAVGHIWTVGADPKERAALWRDGVLTDLGTLGGNESTAWGISDRGVVVGNAQRADGASRPFVWKNGTVIELPTLGGNFGKANGINRAGNVVGVSSTASGQLHATLWLRQ